MKKVIYIMFVSFCIISCTKNKNSIESGISDYFEKNAKDPKSYESVELKVVDTITVEECIKSLQEDNAEFILSCKSYIEDYKTKIIKRETNVIEAKNLGYTSAADKENLIIDLNKSIERKKKLIDSLEVKISDTEIENNKAKKVENKKDIVCYIYLHKYRLKNGFGGLDLIESYFLFNKNNKILNKSENILEIFSSANQEFKKNYLK